MVVREGEIPGLVSQQSSERSGEHFMREARKAPKRSGTTVRSFEGFTAKMSADHLEELL